jgi:putative ABC transport system permease protein
LESVYTFTGIEGSNPSLSATQSALSAFSLHKHLTVVMMLGLLTSSQLASESQEKVVGDVKQWGIASPPQPEHFTPYTGGPGVVLVLHTSGRPESLTGAVRTELAEIDSSLPLFAIRTMDQVIAENSASEQFLTVLLGTFAGLAVLLSTVGIYGVLSYVVTQRTREIGIRMSLGASSGDVLRLVLGQGFRLVLVGFAVGIAGALAVHELLANLLHSIKPHDPAMYLGAAAVLSAITLLACYGPARRAAKVDPIVALRYE